MNERWPKEGCVGSSNSSVSNWNVLIEWWTFPLCFTDLIASGGIWEFLGAGPSSPNLSPTPFFHFLCSRIIYSCFHPSSWLQLLHNWLCMFSSVKSWGGECRNRFLDQSFIWLKIVQLVGWYQAGQIHWGYFEVLDASSHPLLHAGIKAYTASVANRNSKKQETKKLCVEANQV